MLENIFIYATIWSLGVTTNTEGRKLFELTLREIIENRTLNIPVPEGNLYDLSFNITEKTYSPWTETIVIHEIDPSLNFNEIVVPTMDSIRIKFLYKTLLLNKYHCLSPGPTGTGKSVNINSLLGAEMPENYQYISLTFSAQTSANQTQDLIDGKVQRRRNR